MSACTIRRYLVNTEEIHHPLMVVLIGGAAKPNPSEVTSGRNIAALIRCGGQLA
jgi:hypothetical protein